MTAVRDKMEVELTFNNRQFEQGVRQSTESLNKFKSSLNFDVAETGLMVLDKAVKAMSFTGFRKGSTDVGNFGKSAEDASKKVGLLKEALDGVGVWLKKNIVDDAYKKMKSIVKLAITVFES